MFELSLQTLQWFCATQGKFWQFPVLQATHPFITPLWAQLLQCPTRPFSATAASLLFLHCIRHPPPWKLLLTSVKVILKCLIHSNRSLFLPPFSSFIFSSWHVSLPVLCLLYLIIAWLSHQNVNSVKMLDFVLLLLFILVLALLMCSAWHMESALYIFV